MVRVVIGVNKPFKVNEQPHPFDRPVCRNVVAVSIKKRVDTARLTVR